MFSRRSLLQGIGACISGVFGAGVFAGGKDQQTAGWRRSSFLGHVPTVSENAELVRSAGVGGYPADIDMETYLLYMAQAQSQPAPSITKNDVGLYVGASRDYDPLRRLNAVLQQEGANYRLRRLIRDGVLTTRPYSLAGIELQSGHYQLETGDA